VRDTDSDRRPRVLDFGSRTCLGPTLGPSGGLFWHPPGRKLRRVNEKVDGYEPGGRTFESCRAHQPQLIQSLPLFSQSDWASGSDRLHVRVCHTSGL